MNDRVNSGSLRSEVSKLTIDGISRRSPETISREDLYEVNLFF